MWPETRDQRKARIEKGRVTLKTPTVCVGCGGSNLRTFMAEWFAHPMNASDLHNTAELAEHQCQDCAISFWT